ncbi:MAG: IS4 family transposase [Myxococcota bacterium]|jgi:hypothetical protein|nr:IS4 family transposase [Myxococcota bacterium]
MRTMRILNHLFSNDLCSIHAARLKAIFFGVEALLSGGRLSLTALGRAAVGTVSPKHNIKRIDRLLGNRYLDEDRLRICRAIATQLVGQQERPMLLVDWTLIGDNHNALVAAIARDGRALTVYFEVHPRSMLSNRAVEHGFVERLRDVLPKGCRPTLVTDAGFRNPWLAKVASMGWDYVARLTTWVLIKTSPDGDWTKAPCVERLARNEPLDLGHCQVSRRSTMTHRVVVSKRFTRNPRRATQKRSDGYRGRGNRQIRRRSQTPWLLATTRTDLSAAQLCRCYATRMQIEEVFRDTKNPRFGWSFAHARSRCAHRHAVLLLLAALAAWVLTVVGLAAEHSQLHLRYQANTIRRRRVLSLFHLGKTIVARARPSEIAHLNLFSAAEGLSCYEII